MTLQSSSFHQLLKFYRDNEKWKQPVIAKKLGIALRTYQDWEEGKRVPLSPKCEQLIGLFHLSEEQANLFRRAANQVAPEIHNLPFARNFFFTGRETYLVDLERSLEEGSSIAITQPTSINGLGGIGKTQVALQYSYNSFPKKFRCILWVQAENTNTLDESYLKLADLLNLPEYKEGNRESTVQAVKSWLTSHTKWLLILDNVNDVEQIRDYIPTNHSGRILLTTRLQSLGNIAVPVQMTPMTPEEGLHFLLKRSRVLKEGTSIEEITPSTIKDAAELVKLLGGHPLALDQVGAYIEDNGSSFASYLELYTSNERPSLLGKRGSVRGEHPDAVTRTIEISLQGARKVCSLAPDVLTFCSYLSADAIPEELFRYDEQLQLHPILFDEAIGALRRFSLITRNIQEGEHSVHRLVQAIVKDAVDPKVSPIWIQRVLHAINLAFPHVEQSTWLQSSRLLPHALEITRLIEQMHIENEDAARLCYEAASYLHDRARYSEAESLYLQGIRIREHLKEGELSQMAQLYNGLGTVFKESGNYPLAEKYYKQALSIYQIHLEPKSIETANVLNNLGDIYYHQGLYEQADRYYQQALPLFKDLLKSPHPILAAILSNIAACYVELGKEIDARTLYKESLSLWKELNQEHFFEGHTNNNYAILLSKAGDYKRAEELFLHAQHVWTQNLGKEHPQTTVALYGLAELAQRQNHYEKAEELYLQVQLNWENTLGALHAYMGALFSNLAAVYRDQGKYQEAEQTYEKALSILEKVYRIEETEKARHPFIAETLQGFAQLRVKQGRNEEARGLYTQALGMWEQTIGPDKPQTQEIRAALDGLLHT